MPGTVNQHHPVIDDLAKKLEDSCALLQAKPREIIDALSRHWGEAWCTRDDHRRQD